MVRVPEDEFEGLLPLEPPDAEVEPILGGDVESDIGVPFYFDGEGGGGEEGGSGDIASREAAVDDYVGSELYVGPVWVPSGRFLGLGSHWSCVIIMHL